MAIPETLAHDAVDTGKRALPQPDVRQLLRHPHASRGAFEIPRATWTNAPELRSQYNISHPGRGPLMSDELPPRESMEFDVVVVGAGPAGLSTAIRLKQLSSDISVVVVEKGSEVGAHILSGAVIDPIGLDRLLPDWRNEDTPIKTAVADDRFYYLSETRSIRLPNFMMPPLMNNHGNYIVSLGNVCRWLATKAEALGVEIYPGFAATEVLYDANGAVTGVATGDMGV